MAFNPFEHHHHHDYDDHDHDHDVLVDPAQKSLADALRVSFAVLKLVMVVLIVIFLGSGVFIVAQGEVAIVTRFGSILGSGEDQVVQPGKLHFAFPYPVDRVVRIPTIEKQLKVTETFWFAKDTETRTPDEMAGSMSSLNPAQAGSLITGDANIVHVRLTINYQITDPVKFVTNVADTSRTSKEAMIVDAQRLVRAAGDEGIVAAMAQVKSEEIIRMQVGAFAAIAQPHAQQILDDLETGIRIRKIEITESSVSPSLREAYRDVLNAQNVGGQARLAAEEERQKLLAGAAGEAHEALWAKIREYELATEAKDTDAISRLDGELRKIFTEQRIQLADGSFRAIGGEAASIINQAKAASTEIASAARKQADTFHEMKVKYDKRPMIELTRLWEETRQRIMAHPDSETFFVPPGQFRIRVNRDPLFLKEQEKRRQDEANEAKKKASTSSSTSP